MRPLAKIIVAGLSCMIFLMTQPVALAEPTDGSQQMDSAVLPAASWLGGQLASHDGLALTSAGQPDYASTAYSVLGLAQSGYGADQIRSSAKALANAGDAFIGTTSDSGTKATAVALMMLATSTASMDMTAYQTASGPRNLEAALRSSVHGDGQVGDYASIYGQSFAILALTLTADGAPESAVTWLLAQACVDTSSDSFGGYGFSSGSCTDTDTDSTALAVRALVAAGASQDDIAPAVTYLRGVQDSSGGFASALAGINANSTGLAAWALGSYIASFTDDEVENSIAKAQDYLLTVTFQCAPSSGDPEPTDLFGAVAYDEQAYKAALSSGLTPAMAGSLVSSTAQAILGLGEETADLPTVSTGIQSSLPEAVCTSFSVTPAPTSESSSSAATPSPTPEGTASDSKGGYRLLYGIAGVMVVLGVYLGWRFLLSGRRR